MNSLDDLELELRKLPGVSIVHREAVQAVADIGVFRSQRLLADRERTPIRLLRPLSLTLKIVEPGQIVQVHSHLGILRSEQLLIDRMIARHEPNIISTTDVSSHPEFANAVREALTHMRFRPAIQSSRKVRQWVEQNFAFRITPPRPAPADTT